MKKTRDWKQARHTARVQKRTAKARKTAKNRRNRNGGAVIAKAVHKQTQISGQIKANPTLLTFPTKRILPEWKPNLWKPEPMENAA